MNNEKNSELSKLCKYGIEQLYTFVEKSANRKEKIAKRIRFKNEQNIYVIRDIPMDSLVNIKKKTNILGNKVLNINPETDKKQVNVFLNRISKI